MVFSSLTFLFYFLPLFLAGMLVVDGTRWKTHFLTAISLVFYAWGEPLFVVVMLASIVGNHWAGLRLERGGGAPFLWFSIGVNLVMLALLKYAAFLLGSVSAFLPVPAGWLAFAERIPLPIGISFFTFQSISYLVDIHRRELPAQRSLVVYAAYISVFPQLIAGPIVRYAEIRRDLEEPRRTRTEDMVSGLRLFAVGLCVKVLLANPLGQVSDQVFGVAPSTLTVASAWLGLVCYFVQIFFDFSGYSTMAIGLGRFAGFHFPENFRAPYRAASITDFWRRWHITLSSFFRDYVYIPLGGNRRGRARNFFNLVLVFVLCGLWHGASWNFVLWGAYHGFALLVEKGTGLDRRTWAAPWGQLYTFLVVAGGWVLFRAENLAAAQGFYQALLGFGTGQRPVAEFAGPAVFLVLGAAALAIYVPASSGLLLRGWVRPRVVLPAATALAAWMLVVGTYNPFIYFRF
jgi:alginate O-acetyltransferase complex protein AlgI